MRTEIFTLAWRIFRNEEISFSIALKKAWKLVKLSLGKPTVLEFIKVEDGSLRRAEALITTIESTYITFIEVIGTIVQYRRARIENILVS